MPARPENASAKQLLPTPERVVVKVSFTAPVIDAGASVTVHERDDGRDVRIGTTPVRLTGKASR